MTDLNFDLIVVGCGAAGLSTAVSAAESGLRVAVLERARKEERGGQTRFTEAYFRMKNHEEVTDDFDAFLAENSGYYQDPDFVAESLSERSAWSVQTHPRRRVSPMNSTTGVGCGQRFSEPGGRANGIF